MTQINFEYPDLSRVLGLSTSHWTGLVDWQKAKSNGVKFAIIKAAHGTNTNIKWFKENYRGAKDAGVLVGAYSWLTKPTFMSSAGGQARKLASFLKDYPTDLPPCIDFEPNVYTPRYDPKRNCTASDLWGFVVPFEDAYGKRAMIYTGPAYWGQYGSIANVWAGYSLWQAQYNHGTNSIIKPWSGFDFLQWTETGKGVDYGVPVSGEQACELNYWRGTEEELFEYCGKVSPAPSELIHVEINQGDKAYCTDNAKSVVVIGQDNKETRFS